MDGYLRHLLADLDDLQSGIPEVWCAIGPSGGKLAQRAVCALEALGKARPIQNVLLDCDRKEGSVSFCDKSDPVKFVRGARVLLIDGNIHLGNTFRTAYKLLESAEASAIVSYALVVRSGSSILPNRFGLMIGDHDRAVFLTDQIRNNRLLDCGCVRKLSEKDGETAKFSSGQDAIDKWSWSDYFYEGSVDPWRKTYVYERNGAMIAYVSFKLKPSKMLFVDAVAVDKSFHGQGIGGYLLRWAETCGRHAHCCDVSLWALRERASWYQKHFGFAQLNRKPMSIDGSEFVFMGKKLLYNLPDEDTLVMGE